jgi:hypothetical protein
MVAAATEHDVARAARRSGGRGDAGRGGQGLVGGEPATGVTDLGQQGGGADAAGAGQAGEHRRVSVGGQGLLDAGLDRGDPLPQADQQRDQLHGDDLRGVSGRPVGRQQTRRHGHEDHAQLDSRRRRDAARTAKPLRPEMCWRTPGRSLPTERPVTV